MNNNSLLILIQVKGEQYFEKLEKVKKISAKRKKVKRQKRITGTTRRTMFPIKNEIKYFFRKMIPLMRRLPTQARATLKLSIVNMVIDQL